MSEEIEISVIPKYNGKYGILPDGSVFELDGDEAILIKPAVNRNNGKLSVPMTKTNGVRQKNSVARMVHSIFNDCTVYDLRQIKHKNGNKYDCRAENLYHVSYASVNKGKFRGVKYNKISNKWDAYYTNDEHVRITISSHTKAIDAARAYDKKVLELYRAGNAVTNEILGMYDSVVE